MGKFYGKIADSSDMCKTFFCILFSPVIPILLTNALEQARENTRKLIQYYDHGVENAIENCKNMKYQLTKFLSIELGNT